MLTAGARRWPVYLPAGASWRDAWTDEVYPGGATVTVAAPLERIPLFLRDGADLPIRDPDRPGSPRTPDESPGERLIRP